MSTDDSERDELGEDVGEQDEEQRPGGEVPREPAEDEIDAEAGENPS